MEKKLPGFFEQLLGLVEPWYISKVEQKELEVHIRIDFKRGAKFLYEGELCRVHDKIIRQWRHMNLFQYKTYLHAYIPRIHTPDGIKQVQVPWAREESGFTLIFEASILSMVQVTSVTQIHTRASLDTVESSGTPNFAYTLIRMFKKGYDYQRPSWAGRFFHQWIKLYQRSKVPEMLKAAQAILTHLKGIMAYFTYRVTNAVMEGNNSKLRTITKRSYGFKTLRYLRLMIFLVFGKLKFDVPKLL